MPGEKSLGLISALSLGLGASKPWAPQSATAPRLGDSAALASRAARGGGRHVVSQGSRPSLVVPAEDMDLDRLDLNPRIVAAVKKGVFADVSVT